MAQVAQIDIDRPYKDCVQLYGMRQCGKSTLLKYLLVRTPANWVLVDTLHQHGWKPLKLKTQQIVRPPYNVDLPSFLDQIIEQLWNKGNFILAVEELDAYQTVHKLSPALKKLINWGGNRGLALWYTARRLADVHKDIVANCEHHFIFKAYVPNDIEYYKKFVGAVAEEAMNLPKYHYYYYRVGSKPILCRPISP